MKKMEYKAPTAVIYELDVENQMMLTGSGAVNLPNGGTSTNIAADAKGQLYIDEYDEYDE